MKKILVFILILLTLASIPATVYFLKKDQDARTRAAPATTVSFSPSGTTVKENETFTENVLIDTGENQVVLAEIKLSFDATKLEAQSITNGPLFPKIYSAGTVSPGYASIGVGAQTATQPINGTGIIAIIQFKALAASSTPVQIDISQDSYVGGLHETTANVLAGRSPAHITILTSNGSTATTVNSPTPSLKPTMLLVPTITSTPIATVSAVTISLPEESILSKTPLFSGKAPPGSTVTIVIQSDPITVTLTANADGTWSYTPTEALPEGPHTIIASAVNPNTGNVETASGEFTVGTQNTVATESAMPTSGSFHVLILFISLSCLLIVLGATSLATEKNPVS